jgi:hypothetical protein
LLPGSHLIPVLLSREKPLLLPFVAFAASVVSAILTTKSYAVKENGRYPLDRPSVEDMVDFTCYADGTFISRRSRWPAASENAGRDVVGGS